MAGTRARHTRRFRTICNLENQMLILDLGDQRFDYPDGDVKQHHMVARRKKAIAAKSQLKKIGELLDLINGGQYFFTQADIDKAMHVPNDLNYSRYLLVGGVLV